MAAASSSSSSPDPWDHSYPEEKDHATRLTWGRQLFRWMLLNQSWYQKYCGYKVVTPPPDDTPEQDTAASTDAEETTGLLAMQSSSRRSKRKKSNKGQNKDPRQSLASKYKIAKLDSAWAYYEHVTLPRHHIPGVGHTEQSVITVVQQRGNTSKTKHHVDELKRAEPGERHFPTRLYKVWETKEAELADFGIGVGLYFYTLKCLAIIMFLAGFLSYPVLHYYASPEYNDKNSENPHWPALQTSAICTNTRWAPCPSCEKTIKQYAADSTQEWFTFNAITDERYATAVSPTTGEPLYFLKNSECPMNHVVAYYSYATMIFVTFAVLFMQVVLLRARARDLDLASQTSTDYSIEIENPPKDARDPQKWKDFLEERFGHVTAVTVTLDNEDLVNALLERRKFLTALEQLIPRENAPYLLKEGRLVDIKKAVEVANAVPWYSQYILGQLPAEQLQKRIETIEEEITREGGLASKKYDVSNVFVTFEKEQSQQDALHAFNVPGIDVVRQKTSNPDTPVFEGTVLQVREPPEPSSVRWQDLDENWMVRMGQRLFTIAITFLCMVAGFVIVTSVRYYGGIAYAALAITTLNSGAPTIFQYLVAAESHSSQGEVQSSLFSKNVVFLWFNTAIVSAMITPFVRTLENTDEALIPAMLAVFITEMFQTPVTQMLDMSGQFQRFFMGPLAPDQKRMNVYFQGTPWQLAERYTNMTTVLFLTFYYAVLFPAGYFFAAVTLFAKYWTDKYCLLRYWAPAPVMGTAVAQMSSFYFLIALAFYATISAYNIASFPYDNSCESNITVGEKYLGKILVAPGDGSPAQEINVLKGEHEFFFCNQDMLRSDPPIFPPTPENQPAGVDWMTDEQEFTSVYSWTSAILVAGVVIIFVYNAIVRKAKNFFFASYKERSAMSSKGFTEIEDIFGYVPQARLAGYPFPILLCDITNIERGLVGWNDPDENFGEHNVVYDLDVFMEDGKGSLFSSISHWPVHSQNGVVGS